MIKTSAILSIHVIHVILRDMLIFFIILFVAFFFWLKTGISVDNLTFGHYKIDGLYIKLDKKLTLKVHEIVIPRSKSKPSFDNVDKVFDNIKYLFTFFEYIELEKVYFQNNNFNIIFADDILYITSDDYEIAGNIEREGKKYLANVSMLYLKKDNIDIHGTLLYNMGDESIKIEGLFDAYHIKGSFRARKENNSVDFTLKSEAFNDLKTLIDKLPLTEIVKSWTVEKVQAKKYRLNALSGRVIIEDDGYKIDFNALKGNVLFEDVKIYFKEGLSPIIAEDFIMTYENGGVYFDLKNPMYKDRDLSGSKVSVINLIENPPIKLILDLHIKSVLDTVVQEMLHAYKLEIPIRQKGERANVDMKLELVFKKPVKKTSVFVNIDLGKSDVYINKTKFAVDKGNIQYDKGFVTIKDLDLKESWYDGRLNGKIDLKIKKADLTFDAKKIQIGNKGNAFSIKNKTLPFTLDYSKNIITEIPSLKLKVIGSRSGTQIKVEDIKKIKPYMKEMGLTIDGGSLDITTKDFNHYTFKGVLRRNSCFFYEKEHVCHTKIPCNGTVKNSHIHFYAFNKRFHYNSEKSRIKLKKLNIDLEKFLAARKKSTKGHRKKLVILGENSHLRYNKHTIVTDHYDVEIKSNGNIKAMGSLDGDIIKFDKKSKVITMKALRVKDKFLHPLTGFSGLKKGRYTITISGEPKKEMKGKIIVEGGVLSDFKAYNNTLAFMNTIPALATLQDPGFSEKGFNIKEGVVEYSRRGDKITFDSVYIKGASATIMGKGEVNMKTKSIKMDLAIQTARELGKVIGSLPLLGYILTGKDKCMTVGLKITGTLNQPKVETSAAEDMLTLPLQLLKRTIESPAHIINE